MGILGIVLLVFFVFVAILLILLVLAQDEEGDSLGGIFAGGSGSAFGSRSGNVLTRATTILGSLFLIISLGLALMNRGPSLSGVEAAGRAMSPGTGTDWFMEDEVVIPPSAVRIDVNDLFTEEESSSGSDTETAQ